MKRTLLPLLLVLLSSSSWSQESTPAEDPPALRADTEVSVAAAPEDRSIARRLTDILVATGRYDAPSVRVDDGVVFLEGRAKNEKQREWAGTLALRTEGVVTVVNDMAVEEEPLWNFAPALGEMRDLWRIALRSLPLIALGSLILLITLVLSRSATRVLTGLLTRGTKNRIVELAVEKALFGLIVMAGFYLFLHVSGLTSVAATLLGGTGLVGLILGLAFRDIAENFLASLLLSVQQPFHVGDTIEVGGHTGVVQTVTLRGTVLMDFEGNYITISNATIYKSTIKNFTANPKLRIDFLIGVGYDASISRAQTVAQETLSDHPAVLADPGPQVLVETLAASTVNLRVYAWIDGARHSKARVRSALMRLVVRAFDAGGISLPDEQREVIFPQGVPVRMLEHDPTPSADQAPPESEPDEDVSAGEGELTSEVDDLRDQAAQSRTPEQGADILQGST